MRRLVVIIACAALMLVCGSTAAMAGTYDECEHDLYEDCSQEATCEYDGFVNYYCWKCGYEETAPISATGHSFGSWFYESEWDRPDCQNEGMMIKECQNADCWETRYKTVPAKGHSYGNWHYAGSWDRPDCTYSGTMTKKCKRDGCSAEKYKTVPALGHKFKTTTQKAKLGSNGSVKKVCSRCGYNKSSTKIYAPKRIKLSKSTFVYDGKVKKPTVKVYNNCGNLIDVKHYTVTYQKGRKLVGKYKVTVTFKESSQKYRGKLTTSFKINPKPTSITSLTAGQKSFTAKWKKVGKQINGYQLRFSSYSDMYNSGYKTFSSPSKVSAKISTIYGDETYYVQIRTYKTVNGNKIYSSWSKKKTVRTKAPVVTYYEDDDDDYYYDDDDDNYGGTIYITRTGECYHTHACGNGTYFSSTLAEAQSRGLRPCQKCF